MTMDFSQKCKWGFVAVLKYPLNTQGIFSLEYRIKSIKKGRDLCSLTLGCVVPSFCPFPAKDTLGNAKGAASLVTNSFGRAVVRSGSTVSSDFGPPFSIEDGKGKVVTAAVVVDLKSPGGWTDAMTTRSADNCRPAIGGFGTREKRASEKTSGGGGDSGGGGRSEGNEDGMNQCQTTMAFTLNGIPLPSYLVGLPPSLYFAVEVFGPMVLEFVSLSKRRHNNALPIFPQLYPSLPSPSPNTSSSSSSSSSSVSSSFLIKDADTSMSSVAVQTWET